MSYRISKRVLRRVLLVDDDIDLLHVYERSIRKQLSTEVVAVRFPSEAAKRASRQLFDLVLIDVTMTYLGTPFGGLELCKQLLPRYGMSSLLVYSQIITDELLRQYEYAFNFLEKGQSTSRFIRDLGRLATSLRRNQSVFVAMPVGEKYERVFETIAAAIDQSGYRCVRIDRQHFTESILDRIHTEIREAKVVIFVATDANPNAFYECGFAVALQKEVLTVIDSHNHLPFDIRQRNVIAYASGLPAFKKALCARLAGLTKTEA